MLGVATLLLATASSVPEVTTPKRERPDYGAPRPGTTPGEVALWAPRVALFPAWLVSEYAVRRPLGAFVTYAEREQWPVRVIAFFTFGERQQITLFPSAFFDFGLKPSLGFNLSWRYFLAERSTLTAHVGTWGPGWIAGKVSDRYELGPGAAVSLEASVVRRKDWVYYGIGPHADLGTRYRYGATSFDVAPSGTFTLAPSLTATTRLGLRGRAFGTDTCCGPSLQSGIANGRLPPPPGLGQDFVAAYQGVNVDLDTRGARPKSQTGFRLQSHAEAVFAPGRGDDRRAWLEYGGEAGAAIDMWSARTLSAGVTAELTDPLLGDVPFTDLASLGGERPMRGYLPGTLRDRSSLVGTLRYQWPVWVFLDGAMQVDVGNVFGPHFRDFSADLLRMSTSIGVRSTGNPDSAFEILVAGGTDTFGDGFRYSTFRLVLGSHHGF